MNIFGEARILESWNMVIRERVETARSVKRRRRKPWAKPRMQLIVRPDPTIFRLDARTYVCHPSIARQLRKEMERQS
jgi:hypothetical protein